MLKPEQLVTLSVTKHPSDCQPHSLQYFQHLEQGLAPGRCSVNVCSTNEGHSHPLALSYPWAEARCLLLLWSEEGFREV